MALALQAQGSPAPLAASELAELADNAADKANPFAALLSPSRARLFAQQCFTHLHLSYVRVPPLSPSVIPGPNSSGPCHGNHGNKHLLVTVCRV